MVTLLVTAGTIEASGIDADAYAKSVSMSFFVGLGVRASVDTEGGLGALVIDWGGKDINVAKSELTGLGGIDLQTMKVERDAGPGGDRGLSMVVVSFLYGEERVWEMPGLGDHGKLLVRPCVRYLFSDGHYVTRDRAAPSQHGFQWATFGKLLGKEEFDEGIERSFVCPLRRGVGEVLVRSKPNETKQPESGSQGILTPSPHTTGRTDP
ncbi:hypothetical protein N9Y81_02540 [Akkermansiaceae bacterium]|nr:hypothetical protein [Akkermansiaceae bacterium]